MTDEIKGGRGAPGGHVESPAGQSRPRPEAGAVPSSSARAVSPRAVPRRRPTPHGGASAARWGGGAPAARWGGEALADLAAVGLLGLVVVVFFAPVLFGPWHLPAGGGDLASFLYPMYRFIADRFLAGDLPLWNPHQYAGAPLATDNQAGLYYPPLAALFLLWPRFPYGALEGMVMLHVWGAGAATYAGLRIWRRVDPVARPAALIGALAFMFGDVLITHLGNLNFDAVAAWLPLALAALHRAIDAGEADLSRRWAMGCGMVVGVAALAGHAQVTFFTALALAVWALWRLGTGAGLRAIVALAIALAVAAGLAAVMLLPTIELRGLSARAGFDYAATLEYALPAAGLLGLAMPGFFGRGPAGHWAPWPRVELGYVGVLPLALAAVALGVALLARRDAELPRRFRRDVVGLVLLGALALVLALGPATPLHRLLLGPLHLPFRAPARMLLLTDLALAWLAAFGMDALLRGHAARGLRLGRALALAAAALMVILAAGGALALSRGALLTATTGVPAGAIDERAARAMLRAVAVFAALGAASLGLLAAYARGRLSAPRFAALAIALLAIDLVGLGAGVEIDRADPVDGFHRDEAAAWLRREAGYARIDDAADAWQPGAAQLHGLYDIGGVYNPLQLGIYGYYMDGLETRGSGPFNLLGATYVISDKGAAPSDRDFIVPAFQGDPVVDVWRNERAAPRLMLVPDARVVADDGAAYEALRADDWDPLAAVVLSAEEAERVHADAPPPMPRGMRLEAAGGAPVDGAPADDGGEPVEAAPPDDGVEPVDIAPADDGGEPGAGAVGGSAGAAGGGAEPVAGSVAIRRYGTDALVLVVHPETPSWALLTDIHHPGWRAEVNGVRVPVARADFALRAVRVPAGCSEIVMRFRPTTWPIGAALSLATLLVAAAMVVTPPMARLRGRPGG